MAEPIRGSVPAFARDYSCALVSGGRRITMDRSGWSGSRMSSNASGDLAVGLSAVITTGNCESEVVVAR